MASAFLLAADVASALLNSVVLPLLGLLFSLFLLASLFRLLRSCGGGVGLLLLMATVTVLASVATWHTCGCDGDWSRWLHTVLQRPTMLDVCSQMCGVLRATQYHSWSPWHVNFAPFGWRRYEYVYHPAIGNGWI